MVTFAIIYCGVVFQVWFCLDFCYCLLCLCFIVCCISSCFDMGYIGYCLLLVVVCCFCELFLLFYVVDLLFAYFCGGLLIIGLSVCFRVVLSCVWLHCLIVAFAAACLLLKVSCLFVNSVGCFFGLQTLLVLFLFDQYSCCLLLVCSLICVGLWLVVYYDVAYCLFAQVYVCLGFCLLFVSSACFGCLLVG